jgi:hypothetical protein
MPTEQQQRDHLVGFRVTERERDVLRHVAEADQRSVTGLLRKILAGTVAGFGATKLPGTPNSSGGGR